MGLPPVVAGLIVYLLLSNAGPLGVLQLLYTPRAMIIAQVILVTPIVAALTRQTCEDLLEEYDDQLRSLGASSAEIVTTLLWDGRYRLITAVLAGFGRAIAEVGAVMIVGGNIDHVTRTMTTAIALETSKGNIALALALGMILLAIALRRQCGPDGCQKARIPFCLCLSNRQDPKAPSTGHGAFLPGDCCRSSSGISHETGGRRLIDRVDLKVRGPRHHGHLWVRMARERACCFD